MAKGQDPLAALWDALGEDYKPPPPNSISVYDYAEKYGVSRAAAQCKLDREEVLGKLGSGLFRVAGRRGKVKHYWLLQTVKK